MSNAAHVSISRLKRATVNTSVNRELDKGVNLALSHSVTQPAVQIALLDYPLSELSKEQVCLDFCGGEVNTSRIPFD